MKLYSSKDIQAIIEATLVERGIDMPAFIDEVAEKMANIIVERLIGLSKRVVVFAGPERNGAFALAVARHMIGRGVRPEVFLFNIGGQRATPDCIAMRDRLIAECTEADFTEVTTLQFVMPELNRSNLFVDGLFGTERSQPLPGGYQSIVRYVNEIGVKTVALEVPSGMLIDSVEGLINRNIIHARYTLCFGGPRIAFFLKDNEELVGEWIDVKANLSKVAEASVVSKFSMIDGMDIRRIIIPRNPFASKADCGDAILFAGCYGMLGAAVLAAGGALRAGVGKLTVHSPRCGFFTMQNSVPCALFEADPGDVAISQIELLKQYDAVAIGPGLGTADVTIDALDSFLKIANANSRPLVLDADALNCISYRQTMLNHIPVMSIITPHEGEFDRLFGRQPSSYSRLMKAISEAERRHIIIILKGRYTAVVWPDGKVFFNPTGTAALATAGSGDVLTGVLLGLIAQGIRPERAALAGTYIHGVAGAIAEKTHGVYGVIASDVVDNIGRAISICIQKPG